MTAGGESLADAIARVMANGVAARIEVRNVEEKPVEAKPVEDRPRDPALRPPPDAA